MIATAHHYWIVGGRRTDRERAVRNLELPIGLLAAVDAHRRLRGPYSAAGTLFRAIVPAVMEQDPDLVQRHDIELLSAAPELASIVPNSRETLTSMAIPAERTRFYARLRTRRIANGLVEFLEGALPNDGPRTLIVENADHADRTDLEFLTAALRRIEPRRMTLVVCSQTQELADDTLLQVLDANARLLCVQTRGEPADRGAVPGGPPVEASDASGRAWAYLQADCISDDPVLLDVYHKLGSAERARLHDRRAADLEAVDEQSLRLGLIPYHLEHGTDPAGAGARSLHSAQDYCACLGFYDAAAEYGCRGLAVVDPKTQPDLWWELAGTLGLALSVLSRTQEALKLYDQARLYSIKPAVHMAAAYSTAMLYTRHNEPEERDEIKAKAWLSAAIATASLIEDPSDRAFQSAFYRNGLALVAVHLGEPSEALLLVNEAIDLLDHQLRPDEHLLHRSVLKNNRARIYSSLGRLDEALADYDLVIKEDPNHAEYYLERGDLLRRLGRYDEASADYETAMRLSPPFPEIYYNRGDLRLSLSDKAGALADFTYVLELDPALVDAYVNRAGIYLDAGDFAAAYQDALVGLRSDPDNAYLHVVLGQVHMAAGDVPAAIAAYDRAISADPMLQASWAGRAEALFEAGDNAQAIASLDRALDIAEDAALLFNRAAARQAMGQWTDALADLNRARELDPDDLDIDQHIEDCREQLASQAGQYSPARQSIA